LAVLATYHEAESIAVYHYCRSILVNERFNSGLNNLFLLFSKNLNTYEQIKKSLKMTLYDTNQRNNDRNRRNTQIMNENIKTKHFLTKFIRLNGILFDWTQFLQKQYVSIKKNSDEFTIENDHDLLEKRKYLQNEYFSLLQNVLEELDQQLIAFSLTDTILVRIIAICLFAVENSKFENICGDEDAESFYSHFKTKVATVHNAKNGFYFIYIFFFFFKFVQF
jgi:hypothetical protein